MMTHLQVKEIVSAITYKPGWSWIVGKDGDRIFLQADVSEESDLTLDPTRRTRERTPWRTGKRYLSPHMTRQEVVGVVMSLVTDAEMHEAREWFRYRGASIFNPHLDPDVLAQVASKRASFVFRQNAMSMEEVSEQ